jgi:hypothetical protein
MNKKLLFSNFRLHNQCLVILVVSLLLAPGCHRKMSPVNAAEQGTNTNTNTDNGVTTDSDSDADLDSDTDVNTNGLASKYPRDVGIETDSAVVWVENFEEATVSAVMARYDDHNSSGMQLVSDVPQASSGSKSMRFTAGGGNSATDFYKRFTPGYDQLFVRYYVKYVSNTIYHHTGVWVGGYNPPLNWPSPGAGTVPNGDDRISISFEPTEWQTLDFYNYWMKMHDSWGNSLVHQSIPLHEDKWICIELHIKLNPSPGTGAGAELGVWLDDTSIEQFSDESPIGYWIRDKFCPNTTTASECADWHQPTDEQVPLDLQFRNTTDLKLNYFWPQNYISSDTAGDVYFDDMVVATSKIGCIR